MAGRAPLAYTVKAVVSAAILGIVIANVDHAAVGARLAHLDYRWTCLLVGLLILQLLLSGLRWFIVARALDIVVGVRRTLEVTFVGACFNQVLPTTVGGDVVKAWMINQNVGRLSTVIVSLLLDRLLGMAFLGLVVATALAVPGSEAIPANVRTPALGLLAIGGAAAVAVLAVSRMSLGLLSGNRLGDAARSVCRALLLMASSPRFAAPAALVAIAIHLLSIAGAWCAARAVGAEVPAVALFTCIPLAMLVATAPISIGGWGVREGALVFLLALYGVPSEVAVSLSVVFGLGLIAASMPGIVVWLVTRGDVAQARMQVSEPDGPRVPS